MELVNAVGEQRASPGRVRQAFHDFLQRLERDAAALTDHVEGHVAGLEAALDVVDRRVASLVLAIGEHDQRLASGLAPEHLDASPDLAPLTRCAFGDALELLV